MFYQLHLLATSEAYEFYKFYFIFFWKQMINTQDEFARASGKYTVDPPRDSQGNEDSVHPTPKPR